MEIINVELDSTKITANYRGFNTLSELGIKLLSHQGAQIHIACDNLSWIDAHLSAPLMTLVAKSRSLNNHILLKKLKPEVRKILAKNNTLSYKEKDIHGTTIPVKHFGLDEGVEFAKYTKLHLSRKEMPVMSQGLKLKFFEGLDELFVNSSIHSKSPVKVTASGQYYPHLDKIAFVISDGGIGIESSLNGAGIIFEHPQLAIDWAMQNNNTGRSGDIPGGLGLSILKEFVKLNGGRLAVCSHGGYWEMDSTGIIARPMRSSFPGTIVMMEILTSDKNSYDIDAIVNPKALW